MTTSGDFFTLFKLHMRARGAAVSEETAKTLCCTLRLGAVLDCKKPDAWEIDPYLFDSGDS